MFRLKFLLQKKQLSGFTLLLKKDFSAYSCLKNNQLIGHFGHKYSKSKICYLFQHHLPEVIIIPVINDTLSKCVGSNIQSGMRFLHVMGSIIVLIASVRTLQGPSHYNILFKKRPCVQGPQSSLQPTVGLSPVHQYFQQDWGYHIQLLSLSGHFVAILLD